MNKDKTLGVKDIAKLANVSIGTVDRVLHNREGVSLRTKEKILAIIKQYNYEPNIIAQSLTKKNIKTFKVLIPKSSKESTYWDGPLEGIKLAIQEIEKYSIHVDVLFFDQNNIQSFTKSVDKVDLKSIHGLIIAPMFKEESIELISRCDEYGVPYVLINSDINEGNQLAYYGPNLFQSGLTAANIIDYSTKPNDDILIVNISKELYTGHHLYIKQEAFISYFNLKNQRRNIHSLDIRSTNRNVINKALEDFMNNHAVKVIFVTNSRVSSVAFYLESKHLQNRFLLVGFDYLQDNIKYLEKEFIDFLICHKPVQQGYRSLIHLFNYVKFGKSGNAQNFSPIDIISLYNYKFYDN